MVKRAELTWDRLTSQLIDPHITDSEVIGLLSAARDAVIPQDVSLKVHTMVIARFYLAHADDDSTHLSVVARHARILLARLCPDLIRLSTNSTSDWHGISTHTQMTLYAVVAFYANNGNKVGNDNDRKAVKTFLSNLWFMEMKTRANNIPVELIETALVAVEHFDFLIEHHCVSAIPALVIYNCNMLGLEHIYLVWEKWFCFPRTGLVKDQYLIPDEEVRQVLTLSEKTEQFDSDLLRLLELAGRDTNISFQTLATLLAQAYTFQLRISRRHSIGSFKRDSTLL